MKKLLPRTPHARALLLALLFFSLAPALDAQPPPVMNAAETELALKKLSVLASAL